MLGTTGLSKNLFQEIPDLAATQTRRVESSRFEGWGGLWLSEKRPG